MPLRNRIVPLSSSGATIGLRQPKPNSWRIRIDAGAAISGKRKRKRRRRRGLRWTRYRNAHNSLIFERTVLTGETRSRELRELDCRQRRDSKVCGARQCALVVCRYGIRATCLWNPKDLDENRREGKLEDWQFRYSGQTQRPSGAMSCLHCLEQRSYSTTWSF